MATNNHSSNDLRDSPIPKRKKSNPEKSVALGTTVVPEAGSSLWGPLSSDMVNLIDSVAKASLNRVRSPKDVDVSDKPNSTSSSAERMRRLRERRKREAGDKGDVKKPVSSVAERVRRLREKLKAVDNVEQEKKKPVTTSADRMRRLRKSKRQDQIKQTGDVVLHVRKKRIEISADRLFTERFTNNPFGFPCDVCDRLWFKNDIVTCPSRGIAVLEAAFPGADVAQFQTCRTCYSSLRQAKLPKLSTSNGFFYPPIPKDLPPLDMVSERLVSPRLPFMQIRRLRAFGSKKLFGQAVNIPVDVNMMVTSLPRMLDDDHAFNVNIKRHQIHKSNYLSGYVTKSVIKQWLHYLLKTPLYKLYKITINDDFFANFARVEPDDETLTEEERQCPLVEAIADNSVDTAHEFLLAKQQTLMWCEEMSLDLAPSMKQPILSLMYDEHAEELSFPSIYLGHPRKLKVQATPYLIATSETQRTDRRGVKQEHILYVAAKVMRFRMRENISHSFTATDNMRRLTRKDIDDKLFVDSCVEKNLAFLKSIPNSAQYWSTRKRDVFAMIRQLGKPTMFLTLSAAEYTWPGLLRLLYRLEYGKDWPESEDPVTSMGSDLRSSLVNDDPVTCCLYFDKLVKTIMYLLQTSKHSPFAPFRVVDFFQRIEFQQRGSPHAHILLWLENDPREKIGEDMPDTIRLIDSLCTVDPGHLDTPRLQTHHHTFTCYKKVVIGDAYKKCRFGAPFWPMKETRILIPIPLDDTRRDKLKRRYLTLHQSLEFDTFGSFDEFLAKNNIHSYEFYLDVLRAGISRPKIFVRRTVDQRWINSFNPWIAHKLQSNMDVQFILEEYSCAAYVVEYVNKTNRGLSNLHRELIKLRDEYPDKDYTDLIKCLGAKILNSVEMSSQEAAWFLLNLNMSEASRKIEFIQTVWPHERYLVRKTKQELDRDNVTDESTEIWRDSIIDKYEKRSSDMDSVTLAQFVASWYLGANGKYKMRDKPKVIRYRKYDMTQLSEYKREMVLLHIPFRNENNEFLVDEKFLKVYDDNESLIVERRKEFESNMDMNAVLEECKKLMAEETEEAERRQVAFKAFAQSKQVDDDFVSAVRDGTNDDLIMHNVERMSSIVRKRENVMTADEFCASMRCANELQRKLLLDLMYRIFTPGQEPLQIFLTGPAGCGKTWLVKLMMEIVNRFSQQHNSMHNAYMATASTGMAAAAINGSTVHAAFRISKSSRSCGMSVEHLGTYRAAMRNVIAVFVDECSMIGSGMLNQINGRLQQITQVHDVPFGGINMIFTGDLRQLPPVCQSPIYKRSRQHLCAEVVWQGLRYYPLKQVMRQADFVFSTILTKIGDGERLNDDEKKLIESRFVTKDKATELAPEAIRLFFNTADVYRYNLSVITGTDVLEHVATDSYSGFHSNEQYRSAIAKVHRMKVDETGGLTYLLRLQLNRPYMVRSNIDVVDGIVNGVIGWLRYVEFEPDEPNTAKRLWFDFENPRVGRMLRAKSKAYKIHNSELKESWVPIMKRTAPVTMKSQLISVKRTQFPVVEACAITIHKSQGGTYQRVVYDYKRGHDQQLVYVALSRATSIDGLFLTNSEDDFNFYHARGRENRELRNEFDRLERNKLRTVYDELSEFLSGAEVTICTLNVQSLNCHSVDVIVDPRLASSRFLLLSETWTDNSTHIRLPGYRLVNQFKRDTVRSGGVAIYEHDNMSEEEASVSHEMYKYENKDVKVLQVRHTDVGDICTAKTCINGVETLLVAVYISPNASADEIHKFLTFNLMAYSHKLKGLFEHYDEEKLYEVPIILGGDFNTSLAARDKYGHNITEFVKRNFDLDLNSDPSVGTTRAGTCIDGVFTRYVDNIKTRDYISFFSYHKPLMSAITNN